MKTLHRQRFGLSTLLSKSAQRPVNTTPGSPRVAPNKSTKRSSRLLPRTLQKIQQSPAYISASLFLNPESRGSGASQYITATFARYRPFRHRQSCLGSHTALYSGINHSAATAIVLIVAGIVMYLNSIEPSVISYNNKVPAAIPLTRDMSAPVPEGHVGNLTIDQEEKIKRLWQSAFQLCGVLEDNSNAGASVVTSQEHLAADEQSAHKKKRFGVFRRKGNDKSSSNDSADDDKYGQTKQFQETLANQSPESIRQTIWDMVKHDHPDALLLRFLRARKWDVEKALVMLVSTMSWRHNEMKVDTDIMRNGEAGALADEQGGNSEAKRVGHDFLEQIRIGKSFLHGTDRQGRPICVVRVRLHKQGEQCEESLERYTVFLIETARMVLVPPVDTATIVFDMTGFSMANMDYTPVKFMIKCFEANYPESLGAVLVHNSPWIFQGIWKIIRGWLDPIVAAKVHFTNNKSELEEFIEPGRILKELGGDEVWEYQYLEPPTGENDLMKDTGTRDRLLQQRESLVKEFENATLRWIQELDSQRTEEINTQRNELSRKLKEDYWGLDPYVRARSLYDRRGILKEGGTVDWYGTLSMNGVKASEESSDDVD